MATLFVLLHHLPGEPSLFLPFPLGSLTHVLTQHLSLLSSTWILTTNSRERADKAIRFPFPMAVITDADARRWPELDDDDYSSDTSSILTEISSQDFPKYFFERDNRLFPSRRLFPSHGDPYPSYPFPVDGHEQNVRVFRGYTPIPSPPLRIVSP
jgi:hypothetical protein